MFTKSIFWVSIQAWNWKLLSLFLLFDLPYNHIKNLSISSSSTLLKFSIADFASHLHSRFTLPDPPSYHVLFSMANLRTDSPVACRIVRAFLDFLNSGIYFSLFFLSLFFFSFIQLELDSFHFTALQLHVLFFLCFLKLLKMHVRSCL